MNDTHLDVVADFIAQAAGIEHHEAMPQARKFIEHLTESGLVLVDDDALELHALTHNIASRRGVTARATDTDRLIAARIRTHLTGA